MYTRCEPIADKKDHYKVSIGGEGFSISFEGEMSDLRNLIENIDNNITTGL